MLLLIADVIRDGRHLRPAHAERPISRLPRERFQLPTFVNPPARTCLDLPYRLGNRMFRSQRDQPMHVVGNPVEQYRVSLNIARDSGEICVQLFLHLGLDIRFTVLRAKYDVNQQIGMGLGHASSRPYMAGEFYTNESQGWRPGLAFLSSLRDEHLMTHSGDTSLRRTYGLLSDQIRTASAMNKKRAALCSQRLRFLSSESALLPK
jgi:hypothetical protein